MWEIIFPILLVFGFATRFAALGLLFMTAIVELTVPEGWPIHITWPHFHRLSDPADSRPSDRNTLIWIQRVGRHLEGGLIYSWCMLPS
jgi:hypothetical protein